jgi:hypothetical protein
MKRNIAIMENLNAIRIGDFAYSDDLATVLWADKDITSLDGMERGGFTLIQKKVDDEETMLR